MIRLIVSDIDGTMTPDCEHVLNPRYFEVIRALREKGIYFGVMTGRHLSGVRRMFAPVKDEMIMIVENGAYVVWEGRTLFLQAMTKEESEELVRDTRALPGCTSIYDTKDVSYYEPGMDEIYRMMKVGSLYDCEIVEDLLELEEPCIKYSVYHPDGVEELTAKEFVPKWREKLDVFAAGTRFMDLVPKGANKGAAIEKMQEYLSVTPEETLAVGDNINDLCAFSRAGYRFAVANARVEVKEAVDYVTDDFRHDGVLKILEEVLKNADDDKLFESYKK